MNRLILLLFVCASMALGQYTWHTTTTTFPPATPPWQTMPDTFGYLAAQAHPPTGGEVRTTLALPQFVTGVTHTQYLGARYVVNDPWNPTAWKTATYIVTLSGVAGYSNPWTLIVQYRNVDFDFNYVYTNIASLSVSAPATGTVLSSSLRVDDPTYGQGKGVHIRLGTSSYYVRVDPVSFNSAMLYGYEANSDYISEARVGYLDTVAPNNVTGLSATTSNGIATVSWNAAADDANGIGGVYYEIYKAGTLLGSTAATTWNLYANPGENFMVQVKSIDGHRNVSSGSNIAISVPSSTTGGALIDDSLRTGIHSQSVQWGALGESIDMRSMNLNYTIPLLKAQGRGGLAMGISLSYNSQNWRKENSTVTQAGFDVGYGFGWRLQAGSIFPVFTTPTTLSYYIYTDATGAKYKLDRQNGNVWNSKEGVSVWFDTSTYALYFGDGSFWSMGSVSAASEQDAGTRYPTLAQDRHGNQIVITYAPGIGQSSPNTSARISYIDDVRSTQAANWKTYSFTYNTDAIPHLTGIVNNINTGESYTLSYSASTALYEPFTNTQQFGTAVWLNSLLQGGVNLTNSFQYNSSGEMTKIILPLSGELMWNYVTQSYANGRQAREVQSRDRRKAPGASATNYPFTHPSGDSSLKYHSETTLADPSTIGQRRWTFLTTTDFKQGLLSKYEELDNWVVKTRADNTWTDVDVNWPVNTDVTNTIDVGQSYQKQWRVGTGIGGYGYSTASIVYAYGNPNTVVRSQACGFPHGNANYSARFIYYLPTYCTTTEGGVTINSGTATLDGGTLAAMPYGTRLWVDPGSNYRALVTSLSDGFTMRTASYNLAGQPVGGSDGQGLSQAITYGGVGGSAAPTQITPNGNSGLGTSMSWNGFLGLASTSSGNGASITIGYDAYAQPTSKTTPDGATISMGFNVGSGMYQSVVNGRATRTYYDGLNRPYRTETSSPAGTTYVDTEYSSCACSPLGKPKRVSLPYTPGGTIYWTTYTYDGLGRTVSVEQPNGAGTTTYLYEGNTVKVTSPSGKWKKYEMDVLGRLVQVTEPKPGGGTYTTAYTYNINGKLLTVNMPRDGVTQTRTFTYDTTTYARLLTATNPENGTVAYTYNADGTTATKVDAKGIRTEFSYDPYKRVTQMRKLTQVSSVWTEELCQRVNYYYDEGGGTNNGRLTRTSWNWTLDEFYNSVPCATGGGFEEQYAYNAAGRITQKKLLQTKILSGGGPGTGELVANWTYNNEGQVTSVLYPGHREGNFVGRREVQLGFDAAARLNSVQTRLPSESNPSPAWQSVISSVQFNAFGAITSLNHLGLTETRQYNVLGQLTRLTKGSLIDIEYRFSATANDGKIVSQKNWLTGEDVTYQYDELERLISAATTAGAAWGLSWSYDGFGNRLAQTVTQGSGPVNSVLVDANTNRISSGGYQYDANGNMTLMPKGSGSMTMNYDLSNRMSSFTNTDGSENYVYAPDNRRVWRNAGTYGEELIFYSPGGQKMGVYLVSSSDGVQCCDILAREENVYFGGRLVAKRTTSFAYDTLVTDFTADRLQSKGNGSAFYPYGESKTGAAGDNREQFATYTRDAKSGLDYADQRWYASGVGRFTTPDPYMADEGGMFAPTRPTSWSQYAYVEGDPISYFDPRGLMIKKPKDGQDSIDAPTPNKPPDDTERYDDPAADFGTGGTRSPYKPPRITDLTNANAALKAAIEQMNSSCTKKTGMSAAALQEKAKAIKFWDGRPTRAGGAGGLLIGQFLPDIQARRGETFGSVVYGVNAVTLRYGGSGKLSNQVVVGSNFYAEDRSGLDQAVTLVHEFLHSALDLDDWQMADKLGFKGEGITPANASEAFSKWLKANCFN